MFLLLMGLSVILCSVHSVSLHTPRAAAVHSRHRRFANIEGVKLRLDFEVKIPLEISTLSVKLPFTYDVDSGK